MEPKSEKLKAGGGGGVNSSLKVEGKQSVIISLAVGLCRDASHAPPFHSFLVVSQGFWFLHRTTRLSSELLSSINTHTLLKRLTTFTQG